MPFPKSLAALFLGLLSTSLPLGAEPSPPKVLLVVTSADALSTGHPTGLWLEEFAVPYVLFKQAGLDVTVASPRGGAAPIDERSADAMKPEWAEARAQLSATVPLDGLEPEEFQGIFLAGGHGTVVDFVDNRPLQLLLEGFFRDQKPVGAVCHGPSGLLEARTLQGEPMVRGYQLTAFTNSEEKAVKLDQEVPFLLETRLRDLGAKFLSGPDFQPHAMRDRNLVTGQNPASSDSAARTFLRVLEEGKR